MLTKFKGYKYFGNRAKKEFLFLIKRYMQNTDSSFPIDALKEYGFQISLYKVKGKTIGFVVLEPFADDYSLIAVYVLPEYRNKGYARELISKAIYERNVHYAFCAPDFIMNLMISLYEEYEAKRFSDERM